MGKNIVVCSDGTGNTFREHVSNVTHLVKVLDLSGPERQVAFYEQGVGTDPNLVEAVKAYKVEQCQAAEGLEVLGPPKEHCCAPLRAAARVAGLAAGYGLRDKVRKLYRALARAYGGGDDRVFLFGFSRGAFTVRAVAGLMYRCGLPPQAVAEDDRAFAAFFTRAYEFYQVHLGAKHFKERVEGFRRHHPARDAPVRFLGLWDTVKSYGGIWPISLPHLRHNPIVETVCHALSLDEHRSWFAPTSWGRLDHERAGVVPDPRYERQQIKEIWFRGYHSDVGGGDKEAETALTPFRWVLREAHAACLRLNREGERELAAGGPAGPPDTHDLYNCRWFLAELLPRWELDNRVSPPKRQFRWGPGGKRRLKPLLRGGRICLHPSVERSYRVPGVEVRWDCPELVVRPREAPS